MSHTWDTGKTKERHLGLSGWGRRQIRKDLKYGSGSRSTVYKWLCHVSSGTNHHLPKWLPPGIILTFPCISLVLLILHSPIGKAAPKCETRQRYNKAGSIRPRNLSWKKHTVKNGKHCMTIWYYLSFAGKQPEASPAIELSTVQPCRMM